MRHYIIEFPGKRVSSFVYKIGIAVVVAKDADDALFQLNERLKKDDLDIPKSEWNDKFKIKKMYKDNRGIQYFWNGE